MTDKEKLFCLNYLETLNATKSAKLAGYNSSDLTYKAHTLLKKREIEEFLSSTIDITGAKTFGEITEMLLKNIVKFKEAKTFDEKVAILKSINKVKKALKGVNNE